MLSIYKICLFQIFLAACCLAEKQLWNDQTDILLDYFSIGYKASNSTDMPIMDITNGSLSISGLRLGDISTIRRLSDVILETTPAGDTRVSGVFGLEIFELKITKVNVDNYTGPAVIRSTNNSADIAYTIKNPERNFLCRTKWERFNLGNFSNVQIQTPVSNEFVKTNVTEKFNRLIVPALNQHFNTPEFLATLNKTFDFCTLKKYLFPL